MPDAPETRPHAVVINDEEQYSIWPAGRELPAGWRADSFTGTEEECLAYIDETWTDMRPASLRRWMSEHEQAGAS
jgi:MbtH protein